MSKLGISIGALALVALGAVFATQAEKTETVTLNSVASDAAPANLMQVTTERNSGDAYPRLVSMQPLARVNATDAKGQHVTVLMPVKTVNPF